MANKEELAQAMCDVRKSHRIIYEYQRRVLDLMRYISNKYGIQNKIAGRKLFCDPIRKYLGYSVEYPKANLKLPENMWAWDFLYSYVFEFYFGTTVEKKIKKEYGLSVVQVSDSGYFASEEENKIRTDTNSFLPCEESESMLIFVFEVIPRNNKTDYLWKIDESIHHFSSSNEREDIVNRGDDGVYIACKYDICDFMDEASTEKILDSFAKVVEERAGIKLIKESKNS